MTDLLISFISPWLVTMSGVVLCVLILSYFHRGVKTFLQFPMWFQITLLGIIAIGFFVRFYMVPLQPRIYYDEDRYLTYAVTFAKFGKQLGLNAASQTEFVSGDPDYVARVTVPTLNAWVLKGFGYDTYYLFQASKFFSSVQVILVFISAFLFTRRKYTALITTAFFALIPTAVFWSVSIALDSYFVFFSLFAFIAACLYAREQNVGSIAFFLFSTILLLFVRFEAILFLLVLLSVVISIRVSEKLPLFTKKDVIALLFAIPFLGFRGLISLSVLGKTWCCGEATPLEAFSASYILRNTIPNVQSLFNKPEFPAFLTIFALIQVFGKKSIKILPLIIWILCYFFIYSFYFAGMFFTFTFSGSYGRYFLMLIPPLLLLAASTIEDAFDWMKKNKRFAFLLIIIVLISLYPTVIRYPSMVYISPYDSLVDLGPRINRHFLEQVMIPETPENAIIIHPLTGLTLLHGRTAIYFGSMLSSKKVRSYVYEQAKQGVPVFIWQTHTCDFTPEKCEELLELFAFTPFEIKGDNPTKLDMARLVVKENSKP